MNDDPRLDDLLDAWEDRLAGDSQASLDQFVADHCGAFAPSILNVFRRNAVALAAIDGRLTAIGNFEPARRPARFGRYTVTGTLGEGGYGIVYRGFDTELRREVAIKVPRHERPAGAADAEAYLAEARVLASLDHSGIVPVYDLGRTDDGLCYVVSKFMPGGDLAGAIRPSRVKRWLGASAANRRLADLPRNSTDGPAANIATGRPWRA